MGDLRSVLGFMHVVFYERRRVFGGGRGPFGEVTHFFGDDREPFSVFAGARGLNRCVQSQKVGLKRDLFDSLDDLGYLI